MSATTDILRRQAALDVGFAVEAASAWVIACEACTEQTVLVAGPGRARAAIAREGSAWMTSHRLNCPDAARRKVLHAADADQKDWYVTGEDREVGAIGIMESFRLVACAATKDEAREQVRQERYARDREHVRIIDVVEVGREEVR